MSFWMVMVSGVREGGWALWTMDIGSMAMTFDIGGGCIFSKEMI